MSISRRLVSAVSLGRIGYKEAWAIQQLLVNQHRLGGAEHDLKTEQDRQDKLEHGTDTLLLCEHKPVYTIGIRTDNYPSEEEERLKKLGAEFYRTDRGGLITFHGPGQLMAYPILNLGHFKKSIRWYVWSVGEMCH